LVAIKINGRGVNEMKSIKGNESSFRELHQSELEEISGGGIVDSMYGIYVNVISSTTKWYGCGLGNVIGSNDTPTPTYHNYPANQSNILRP
jgi:hypothetical protein